jgi:hypothetical protein
MQSPSLRITSRESAVSGRLCLIAILIAFALFVLRDALVNPGSAQASPTISELRVSPAADADPRNETAIAVSPIDDKFIVGASKVLVGGASGTGISRIGYYFSSDGGASWGSGLISLTTAQKTWNRASDPAIACDAEGNFYICMLMLDESGGTADTGIYIAKSIDGGQTFGTPEGAFVDIGNPSPALADKCYLAIDRTAGSPFKNRIHIVWVGLGPAVVLTSHKSPGDISFSEPVALSHVGGMVGPVPAVGPNGELYVAWEGIGSPRRILFNASTDGGVTFFPPTVARPDYPLQDYAGSLTPPAPPLIIPGVRRMNSFPSMDVDRSQGPNGGRIYIAWA